MLKNKASAKTELPQTEIITSQLKDEFEVLELPDDYIPPKILLDSLATVKDQLINLGIFTGNYTTELPKFLLKTSVDDEKRKVLDEQLGPLYAEESVELQGYVEKVRIIDSMERMASLRDTYEKSNLKVTFSTLPFNQACGEWAGKQRVFWTRESIADRLVKISTAIKRADLFLHFEDAFRPVGVQEGLFKRRVRWIMDQHPEWSIEQILLEAKSKTAITPRLASHKSGAAIDLVLGKISTGELLNLGNKYPEGGALVALNCPFVTEEQWVTRQLFAGIFTMAGFAIYPGEDWHISYGDNLHRVTGFEFIPDYIQPAQYGPIKDFITTSSLLNGDSSRIGDIKDSYNPKEYDASFLDAELKEELAQRNK